MGSNENKSDTQESIYKFTLLFCAYVSRTLWEVFIANKIYVAACV